MAQVSCHVLALTTSDGQGDKLLNASGQKIRIWWFGWKQFWRELEQSRSWIKTRRRNSAPLSHIFPGFSGTVFSVAPPIPAGPWNIMEYQSQKRYCAHRSCCGACRKAVFDVVFIWRFYNACPLDSGKIRWTDCGRGKRLGNYFIVEWASMNINRDSHWWWKCWAGFSTFGALELLDERPDSRPTKSCYRNGGPTISGINTHEMWSKRSPKNRLTLPQETLWLHSLRFGNCMFWWGGGRSYQKCVEQVSTTNKWSKNSRNPWKQRPQ